MKNSITLLFSLVLTCATSQVLGVPEFQWIKHNSDTVGLYDKFEASFWLNAEFENPFDPDDIDVSAEFTSPSGKNRKISGFYSSASMEGWLSRFAWFVRFSANETGNWSYTIAVKDRTGSITSESRKFTVIESPYHGPIKIASNKRYLEHADETPFYGVGMWVNGLENGEVMDELKSLGVNYVSYVMTPLESRASGLGRYDQQLCSLVDKMLGFMEERDMQLALNMWFHSFLSETVWGGGNVRWFENPYQKITSAKDFYRSEEAWKYQEKLYRYMIARWGYSRSLAIWFIVDEVNGTDGWAAGDTLQAAQWVGKIHNYLKTNDPWQHLTTGTRSGGIKEWWQEAYEILDMPGREIYEAQGFPINRTGKIDGDETHSLTYSYRNYQGQVNKLWSNFEKPVIIPETGWDHTFYMMSMPQYQSQYHNAIWVSLASGSAMSPFWWAYSGQLNDNVVTNQILNYRRFTDEIPFSRLTNLAPAEILNSEGDAYAIGSDQLIFGWAVNAETDMAGKTITIQNIQKGKYSLKLFHTWGGRFLENEDGNTSRVVESKGRSVSFDIPVHKITGGHARYIGQDIAFILEPVD
ncbi:MAG: DUF5060 domain-containing protein [Bacteroidetes bacterium]|nr:DUF5060 domain-containing protein [Bacteroidota bacterium]